MANGNNYFGIMPLPGPENDLIRGPLSRGPVNRYPVEYDGFVDYYTTRPTTDDKDSTDVIEDILNPPEDTVQAVSPLPKVRQDDPTERRPKIDISKISFISPASVKYDDFNSYLKSQHNIDRSGFFSGTDFKTKTEKLNLTPGERIGGVAGGLSGDPNPILAGALFGGLADTKAVSDPTGTMERYIPKSGIFNSIASMSIASEFKDMAMIRDAYVANPELGLQNGFIFNVDGKTIRRRPGENMYRGNLDQAGIDQQSARIMERMVTGSIVGTEIVQKMKEGGDDDYLDPSSNSLKMNPQNALLATSGGGYTLRGTFNFGTGTAAMGNMSDFEDIASSTFRVELAPGQAKPVINGVTYNYDVVASRKIARSWLEGARSFNRSTSVETQLAHLQNMIDAATNASNVNTGKVTPVSGDKPKPDAQVAPEDGGDTGSGTPDTGGGDGDDGQPPSRPQDAGGDDGGFTPGGGGRGGGRSGGRRDYQGGYQGFEDRSSRQGPTDPYSGGSMGGRALGGPVGMKEGGFVAGDQSIREGEPLLTMKELASNQPTEESGFINRPPSQVSDAKSVADDIPMKAEATGMVLNAEAVLEAGEQDIAKMIEEARAYRRRTGKDAPEADESNTPPQDINISEGEVYISPEDVAVIGRDRLTKINNRGKPKTEEKIAKTQKAAKGGFVKKKGYAEGTDEEGVDSLDFIVDAYEQFKDRFPGKNNAERIANARKKAAELIEGMNPEEALAIAMIGEASVLGMDGMEAVAHVVYNRMNSTFNEYRDQQSVYDVITRRTGNNPYQFNALEYKTLRKTLKEIATTDYGKAKFKQARQIAEDILAGNRADTTSGSLLFWNPETSTNDHIRDGIADGTYEVMHTQRNKAGLVHEFIRPSEAQLAANTLSLDSMYGSLYDSPDQGPDSTDVSFMAASPAPPAPAPVMPSAPVTDNVTQSTARGPVQFNPEKQAVDTNLNIQGLRNEPDTSFMTVSP